MVSRPGLGHLTNVYLKKVRKDLYLDNPGLRFAYPGLSRFHAYDVFKELIINYGKTNFQIESQRVVDSIDFFNTRTTAHMGLFPQGLFGDIPLEWNVTVFCPDVFRNAVYNHGK